MSSAWQPIWHLVIDESRRKALVAVEEFDEDIEIDGEVENVALVSAEAIRHHPNYITRWWALSRR